MVRRMLGSGQHQGRVFNENAEGREQLRANGPINGSMIAGERAGHLGAQDWLSLYGCESLHAGSDSQNCCVGRIDDGGELFNAYFFRAAIHIIGRYSEPPYLLLEHRVDAARRQLASNGAAALPEAETHFLARTLLALVETAPVARAGKPLGSLRLFEDAEPNIAVFAIACVALLFAEEGKPIAIQDENEFFAIVGALILPRLKDISAFITKRDVAGLSKELGDIKAMY